MRSWTTAGTLHRDPFTSWRENLAAAFVQLVPQRVDGSPFFGNIVQARSGSVSISKVDASPHRVSLRDEYLMQGSQDAVFVNLQLSGRGLTRQHDREIVTLPGDIAVADTRFPYDIVNRTSFSLYSISVPRQALPPPLLQSGVLRLSSDDVGRQFSAMISAYARLMFTTADSGVDNPLYGQHILDLLRLGSARSPDDDIQVRLRLPLILDYIQKNHSDANLSATKAARVFGVSPRYVHRLCESSGMSFSEHLREVRLKAAAVALIARPGSPITAIALACGFSDLSYFTRCFRQRFAESPTEYRRRNER